MEKTILGTPQQNSVAERMNRILNERARSMRLNARLPKNLWVDAVSTTAYLINRGPSVPIEFRLPEEGYADADFAGDIDSRKSTTRFVFTLGDKDHVSPKLSLVNVLGLNYLLRLEIFASEDGQLRVAHLILDYEPLSCIFQDTSQALRAGNPKLARIDVSKPGFLA
nr:uncharacterized protein LOC112013222 [Quercus suber]